MRDRHRYSIGTLVQRGVSLVKAIVCMLLLLLLVSACSTQANRKLPTFQPVTVTFAAWEYERAMYEALAEQFKQEHPTIDIVLVPMEDLTSGGQATSARPSPLSTLRRVVSGADTASSLGITPEALDSGLLHNLQPLMDADPAFAQDDFYAGALEQYTTAQGIWVLPRTFHIRLLAYNKTLLQANDITEPELGWSWNDLLGMAEELARKRGNTIDTYGFFDPSNGMLPLFALLKAQGMDLLTMPPDAIHLDDAEVVETVEHMLALYERGALVQFQPGIRTHATNGDDIDAQQIIYDGRVGIWDREYVHANIQAQSSGTGQEEPEPFSFEVGIIPYPDLTGIFSSSGTGYIISSGAQHPQEAWAWIEFLSRQVPDTGLIGVGSNPAFSASMLPARDTLAQKTGFWDDLNAESVAAYRWALEHQPPLANPSHGSMLVGMLSNAMLQIRTGEHDDVAQALSEAQEQFQQQVTAMHLTPTAASETGDVVVATPPIQAPPEDAQVIAFTSMEYSAMELRAMAQRFHAQHPDMFVQIVTTEVLSGPVDIAMLTSMSDCFATSAHIRSDEDAQAVRDLQPFLDADANLSQDDYLPMLLEPYRHDGHVLGLPYAFTMRTLNYQSSAFEDAGIAPPTAEWTPDDFLAAAQALTTGTGADKRYGYVPLGFAIDDLFFFIRQFGGQLTTGSGDSLRPNFTDEPVVEAIQWYIDLSTKHHVMPPISFPHKPGDAYDRSSYELVRQGQAAMWFDQGYGMFSAEGMPQEQKPDVEVRIAPLPIGGAGLSGHDFGFASAFYIADDAQHPDVCWEWITSLSEDVSFLGQWSIPARTSVAHSDAFVEQASPETVELIAVHTEALETSQHSGTGFTAAHEMVELYWFLEAINTAIAQNDDVATALQAAQETTTAFQACVANGGQPGACAREVDAEYAGYLRAE